MWFSALCWLESLPISLTRGSFHSEFEDATLTSLCTNERKSKTERASKVEIEGVFRGGNQNHSPTTVGVLSFWKHEDRCPTATKKLGHVILKKQKNFMMNEMSSFEGFQIVKIFNH